MEIQSQSDYSQDYSQDVDNLLIKFIKKGDSEMADIKYVILTDDGDNFEFEKSIVENKKSSRTEIANAKLRIEQILAHITEEKEEIAKIEAEIEELEKVSKIADEERAKKLAEAEATNENANNEQRTEDSL